MINKLNAFVIRFNFKGHCYYQDFTSLNSSFEEKKRYAHDFVFHSSKPLEKQKEVIEIFETSERGMRYHW